MSDPRILTLDEANAMLPRLRLLVGEQMARARSIEARLDRLRAMAPGNKSSVSVEAAPGDDGEVSALKSAVREEIVAYDAGWKEVQSLGAVVKDPRTGLVDFYGRVEGRVVWLCWRYGEEAIEHYHELDAGFSARKPLGAGPRPKLLN